jgi:hypothetical protein
VIAQAVANSIVARSVLDLKVVRYRTAAQDAHPGQMQTIVRAAHNLSGNFTITDVTRRSIGENVMRQFVTAVGGTALASRWQDSAKRRFGGGGGPQVGGGGVTIYNGGAGAFPPFPLGGSRGNSWPCGTTPAPVVDYLPYDAVVDEDVTVRVEVKARTAGHLVTPSIYDITVPASPVLLVSGTAAGAAGWEKVPDFTASLSAGHSYALYAVTDNAAGSAYAIGKLVA